MLKQLCLRLILLKLHFFFYFRNTWGYFAVMMCRNSIFCMDMKQTWDESPPVDVLCCWDLFPAPITQQSDLDLSSALPLISIHFLPQIRSCNLQMTLFLSPTILCIFPVNCLPSGDVRCSTWIMDELSFPPSKALCLTDDGQTTRAAALSLNRLSYSLRLCPVPT